MDWNGFINEAVTGSVDMVIKIVMIIFPLFIGIEIIEEAGIIKKISKVFKSTLKHFELPETASLPIIVGQSFGLLYGAGLILRYVDDNNFTYKEVTTISVLFAVCHAVFEDTLLFVAIGGNGFIILGMRILLALGVTYLYGKIKKQTKQVYYI
ncbi:nucleoside recognition domain-containing protein [Halothermothrix orenii]|uniref:Nucleoside recognition domain protein n=1 Tax=Halothermothrix orenii (strain H 168 / OCM 544 / DSM 9562) TaxID=373903 RepID=B8CWB6_HALOH|nr:nucleoside recognition domain-containing protein [Halothermothrix orenii]ACL69585.1 nucleoside recognition domain protein [Halothermothrix orenii H 168]